VCGLLLIATHNLDLALVCQEVASKRVLGAKGEGMKEECESASPESFQ
jgi:hypothetical protein